MLLARNRGAGRKVMSTQSLDHCVLCEGMDRVEILCRAVLGNCLAGDVLRHAMSSLHDLARYAPADTIKLWREIASRLIAAERYLC